MTQRTSLVARQSDADGDWFIRLIGSDEIKNGTNLEEGGSRARVLVSR